MFNEIEEAIVAALQHERRGLPRDSGQPWYVPVANINRQPPDLQGNLNAVLPAVSFSLAEFNVVEDDFTGVGELQEIEAGLREIRPLKFDLLYHLDAWATDLDNVNAIVQRAIQILLLERDRIREKRGDYRLLRIRPTAGRDVPVELERATVFGRQVEYRIECQLLIRFRQTPIEEIVIEKVEWQVSEE